MSAPAVHVAMKPVIDEPPLDVGALKAMLALVLPEVATGLVGAPGTVATGFTTEEVPQATKNSAHPTATMIFKVCRRLGV